MDEIIQEALRNDEQAFAYHKEFREKAVDDMLFAGDELRQWDSFAESRSEDLPKFTINKIAHFIDRADGQYKKNRIDGKVSGWDTENHRQVAEVFTGLIRSISNNSKANRIYAEAFHHINSGGFSAWRIVNSLPFNSFEQELKIKSIADPWYTLLNDVHSTEIDGSDWKYCILRRSFSKEAFKDRWPKATPNMAGLPSEYEDRWSHKDEIIVAEYWKVTTKEDVLIRLSNGKIDFKSRIESVLDDLAEEGIQVVQERNVKKPVVTQYMLSGVEQLEEAKEWAGSTIPIIPAYGYTEYIKGKLRYRGKVRFARDPQQILNYATTANIEAIASSPKDPIFVTPHQMEGLTHWYTDFAAGNSPFLPYRPDPDAPGPPQRGGAPAVQSGLINQVQQADADIQATMGEFIGFSNAGSQSGVAINSLQNVVSDGSFSLIDGLAIAVTRTWEILAEVIPIFYDTERQIRITNADGSEKVVTVNQVVTDKDTGKPIILNDLNQRKLDVVVDVGPSFKTQREEANTLFGNILQTNPQLAQLVMDLFVENIDAPNIDKVKERVRKFLIKQGTVDPTDEELQEMQKKADPAEEANKKIQAQLANLQFRKVQLELNKLVLENKKLADDIDIGAESSKAKTLDNLASALKKFSESGYEKNSLDDFLKQTGVQDLVQQIQQTPGVNNSQPQGVNS